MRTQKSSLSRRSPFLIMTTETKSWPGQGQSPQREERLHTYFSPGSRFAERTIERDTLTPLKPDVGFLPLYAACRCFFGSVQCRTSRPAPSAPSSRSTHVVSWLHTGACDLVGTLRVDQDFFIKRIFLEPRGGGQVAFPSVHVFGRIVGGLIRQLRYILQFIYPLIPPHSVIKAQSRTIVLFRCQQMVNCRFL